ncbi:MAG: YbaB/EbfC family nucleoid-associated protein [Gemmatimonadales bacterium]|nr:MAG: YbaB/EbfC family nucleoid-associated protein [Gemmatimonadales bacterium]
MMDMRQLLQMGQQMQAKMSEVQESLERMEVSATAGGGMVTAMVDGKGQLKGITIDSSVVDPADVEMLEDLVMAAVGEAQKKARDAQETEMKSAAGGLTGGLPLPFKLPGF